MQYIELLMAGKQYGAKLPPDLAEPVEDFHEQDDSTSQADAIRHYIRKGITHEQTTTNTNTQPQETDLNPTEFLLDTARVTLAGAVILGVGGFATGTLGVSKALTGAGLLATIALAIILAASSHTLTLTSPRKTREATHDEH